MTQFLLKQVAEAFCKSSGFSFIDGAGVGTFKETFHAQDQNSKSVAIKVYRDGLSNQRSEREIAAINRCSHPNICRLESINYFRYGDTEFLITIEEYLHGGTLTSRLQQKGALPIDEIVSLGGILTDALSHIASFDLVHRDIKPDNILFRDEGFTPVIVDFGLVRDLKAESLTKTWQLQGPGTPLYAPPEQLLNEKALIDWRADQFSLGVVLSFALIGVHPYYQEKDTMSMTIERVMRREGPTESFIKEMNHRGLPQLSKMSAPWPVQRFRIPSLLAQSWISERG